MCRITISRFYRDWAVFDALRREHLPAPAGRALAEGCPLRCWSAGCASGEEPYTLSLIFHLELAPRLLIPRMVHVPPVIPVDEADEVVVSEGGYAQAEGPVFLHAVGEGRVLEVDGAAADLVEVVNRE